MIELDVSYSFTKPPLVSIGVPVYNASEYISETLNSILQQTYENIEIVVRDNCSSDNSKEIISDFQLRDSRIKFSRSHVNLGAAANYNAVFEQSHGFYFKWAAADDLISPDFIASCVAVLEEYLDVVLAYSKTQVIDGCGNLIENIEDGLRVDSHDPIKRYKSVRQTLRECNSIFGVIRRDILQCTNLIQPYIAADAHLLAELALYGRFHEVPERMFYRRHHEAASSADHSEDNQMRFYDPGRGGRPLMSTWNGLYYDARATLRAPISLSEKGTVFWWLIRSFGWNFRKHMQELRDYVRYVIQKHRAV